MKLKGEHETTQMVAPGFPLVFHSLAYVRRGH